MRISVSVLVPSFSAAFPLGIRSLDEQSIRASDFEVIVADNGTDAVASSRLAEFVSHRTNVSAVATDPGLSTADAMASLLSAASGDYVLVLDGGRRLTSVALDHLIKHADETSADVCLGLSGVAGVRPSQPVEQRNPDPRHLSADDELRSSSFGRMYRRSALSHSNLLADSFGQATPLPPDVRAAAVTSVLCIVEGTAGGVPVERTDSRFRVQASTAVWVDGVLEVTAEVSGAGETVTAALRASVFSCDTGADWPVDSESQVTADGAQVVLRINPLDVRGVGLLPRGIWWPSLRIDDETLLIEIGADRAHGATLHPNRVVVSFAESQRLALDVGGLRHQPIRRLLAKQSQIKEDARGSLLTSRLTNIDLGAATRVSGLLEIGKLPVVAWVEHDDNGDSVLRAWVSGLAGSYVLSTRFTRAPYARAGARLVVDGLGTMDLRPTQAKATATPDVEVRVASLSASAARVRRLVGRAVRPLRR